jgi:hypothetical protein
MAVLTLGRALSRGFREGAPNDVHDRLAVLAGCVEVREDGVPMAG